MSEKQAQREFDAMGRRLKSEALHQRPAFSAELHERIVAVLQRQRRSEASVRWQDAAGLRGWLSLASAAACVAACALLIWRGANVEPGSQPQTVVAENPMLAPVELADMAGLPGKWSGELPSLMDVAMSSQQWAYLDHDAKVAMQALTDQLPLDLGEETEPGQVRY